MPTLATDLRLLEAVSTALRERTPPRAEGWALVVGSLDPRLRALLPQPGVLMWDAAGGVRLPPRAFSLLLWLAAEEAQSGDLDTLVLLRNALDRGGVLLVVATSGRLDRIAECHEDAALSQLGSRSLSSGFHLLELQR